jgi:hypothetical protein
MVVDTDHRGPARLDEALRDAVARVETDPRMAEAIARYLGWYGHTRDATHHPGQPIDLAQERAKQGANRAIERLREDGLAPEAVEKSLSLIERSLPLLEMEACEVLMKARLCFTRLTCEALLAAAKCFCPKLPFEMTRLGAAGVLIKPDSTTSLDRLMARAREIVQTRGCANVTQLVQDAQDLLGPNVTERFTEALMRAGGPFEWLDRESSWFWYIPDGSNRVVQQVQRSLALSGRIKLSMLRSAIRRDNGLGNFTPPTKIIEAVCRRVLGWQIEGDSISQVPAMAQRNDALAPNERLLATILREHGPALERAKLMELCRARGIDDQAFEQLVRPSLLFYENEQGLVASSDTELGTAPTGDAENGDPLAARSQALLSEGKVLLAWKL